MICLLTGIVLVSSIIKYPNIHVMSGNGAALTSQVFSMIPVIGMPLLILGLITFAFSTILGWYYYGERCSIYLFGEKAIVPYKVLWVICVFIGAVTSIDVIWDFADLMNGLMALPNIVAVLLLSDVVSKETKKYSGNHIHDKDIAPIEEVKNAEKGVIC